MANNWKDYYQSRLMSHTEAANKLQDNWKIFMDCGNKSNTPALYEAIINRAKSLNSFMIGETLAMTPHALWDEKVNEEMFGKLKAFTAFALPGPNRQLAGKKYRDVILAQADDSYLYMAPICDAYAIMTTPPDKNGFVNLSFCDFMHMHAIREGRKVGKLQLVICEVNDKLPVVFGDNYMHVSEFDCFIEISQDVVVYKSGMFVPTDEETSIANYVAQLINDGDTIQIGLGTIPEVVAKLLEGKHDLGIHTEVLVNGHLDMIKKGIVNNSKKNLYPGVSVSTFVLGDQELYDYCTENPAFNLYSTAILNDPRIIAQENCVKAINNTLLVELSGQMACDTLGHRQISGIGGQNNFQVGARWSKGGQAMSLLNSTRKLPSGEMVSAIVPEMPAGTQIAVIRQLADVVITEFGIADLRHKFLRERADALIEIAHPDFRGELRKAARRNYYPAAFQNI